MLVFGIVVGRLSDRKIFRGFAPFPPGVQVARWKKEECDISGTAEFRLCAYFIQYAGGSLDLQALVSNLDEIDAPAYEKSFFS